MSSALRSLLAGLFLAVITSLCLVLMLEIGDHVEGPIKAHHDEKLNDMINNLLPDYVHERKDRLVCYLASDERIGDNMPLYVAMSRNQILGYILSYRTSRGYSNPLIFIAGFDSNFNIYKVDIHISHETPGIGDKIDRDHSDYLDSFIGKNLENTRWDVKKFGGDFDFFSGATITSRSAVLATRDAIEAIRQINVSTLPLCKESAR